MEGVCKEVSDEEEPEAGPRLSCFSCSVRLDGLEKVLDRIVLARTALTEALTI